MNNFYVRGKDFTLELQSHLKSYFSIDPETGIISRTDRKNSNGSIDKDGYRIIKIKGRQFKAHRIAWFLYYGESPTLEIDHINRNRLDNRKSNLRLSNRLENVRNANIQPNKQTGVIGVYIDKCTYGLKKVYTTRYKTKTYRFYSLNDAISFRRENGLKI
jgi:hypothetical protein